MINLFTVRVVNLLPFYLMILFGILGLIVVGLYLLYLIFNYIRKRKNKDQT